MLIENIAKSRLLPLAEGKPDLLRGIVETLPVFKSEWGYEVPTMLKESGWLIENGKQGSELRYMTMDDGLVVWTASHMDALRFCRREDAESFVGECSEDVRVVEHQWMSLERGERAALDRELADDARATNAVSNPMFETGKET